MTLQLAMHTRRCLDAARSGNETAMKALADMRVIAEAGGKCALYESGGVWWVEPKDAAIRVLKGKPE